MKSTKAFMVSPGQLVIDNHQQVYKVDRHQRIGDGIEMSVHHQVFGQKELWLRKADDWLTTEDAMSVDVKGPHGQEGSVTVELALIGRGAEPRTGYRILVKDAAGKLVGDEPGLELSGDRPDNPKALMSALSFLGAAGESVGSRMRGHSSENQDLFSEAVAQWAYQASDELVAAQLELADKFGVEL